MKFTTKDYEWSLDGLQKCIIDNNLKSEVIFSTPTAAIVWVRNYSDSQILGALSEWCICQHDVSWNQYVANNKNNVQLFFYDFTQYPKSTFALVGATFTMEKDWSIMDLNCCFVRENHPIKEEMRGQHSDLEAMNHFLGKTFGIDFGKNSPLIGVLNDFKREREKELENQCETKESVADFVDHWRRVLGDYHRQEKKRVADDDYDIFDEQPFFKPTMASVHYPITYPSTIYDDLLDDDLPW